jgi:hypothetical protein
VIDVSVGLAVTDEIEDALHSQLGYSWLHPGERALGRPGADRVMAGADVVPALFVPHDHRDRARLDDQIVGQRACLAAAGFRGRLIRVPDGDQIGHKFPRSHAASFFPRAVKGMGHGVNPAAGAPGTPHPSVDELCHVESSRRGMCA